MDDSDFNVFLARAIEELEAKQTRLQTDYKLGQFDRWWIDLETGTLEFFYNDKSVRLVAEIVDIGSYSKKSGTWKWAWSNDSVPEHLRRQAIKLKELEAITNRNIFGLEHAFEADMELAWDIAALSVMHLSALGCYRSPSSNGDLFTFSALKTVHLVN